MAFVNEYIPADDIKKYDVEKINRSFLKSNYKPSWTADRERDVYLRYMRSGREEFSNQSDFILYWKGILIRLRMEVSGGGRGGNGWTHYKMLNIDFPEALSERREEVISDLKDALAAYKDFGVHSATVNHLATFEF
ncbi:hypothetical protein [Pseudomonas indica]|uniref:hypothetical protein n=1 Tax=Pseudomonas indica TaxID=137658 RepID=UPI0023F86704|nr:hypothetical protein [Pseudomonas indica]MBU3055523.1 hypothetical protein [Pseudomonas indica]